MKLDEVTDSFEMLRSIVSAERLLGMIHLSLKVEISMAKNRWPLINDWIDNSPPIETKLGIGKQRLSGKKLLLIRWGLDWTSS